MANIIACIVGKSKKKRAWFNFGWQPQAQLADGKASDSAQPSPNPSDPGSLPAASLPLPHAMEPKTNPSGRGPAAADVTQNLTSLNHAQNCLLTVEFIACN